MNNLAPSITFEYNFVSDKDIISNKDKRNVAIILAAEATVTIKINNSLYFETELAILEFYKSLYKWKEQLKAGNIIEFHYYTVEYADYEDGAILSLLPFADKARVKSIWAEQNLHNVFELDYIVLKFMQLEENLKRDIEAYFEISLEKFIKHIPFQLS